MSGSASKWQRVILLPILRQIGGFDSAEAFSKNSTFVSREIASIFYDTCVKPLAREFCLARGFRPLATQSTKLLINLSREEILSRERFSTSRERFPIGADFLLNASGHTDRESIL